LDLEAARKDPSARANDVMALHFNHYPAVTGVPPWDWSKKSTA